ncbi:cytochrome c biogenesis CcdA family protein [Corynebacterium sp. ES2794-CONJ1]|uniref:cytochrome c biogenesis CcdA family protein n=1 Tax=unclassified Corynebacterium TaxID=2624378 RepID=UPI00216828EA|nr:MULTISPECIES: cytochrome c biogenesis CcdA family protein [unclassified Corynebacterium]MCS4489756.1 cytochrome c biogenesis CcdA family protein [Corynebacterium sp. ES2775-CONJ]MCS4491235.1 cytochrome c biogenesis CcdA family protein [Corynebacterium sp. ES2715-CONJ3]MCS4531668.1 cytochrome c biogenesis CcdA family protein [Corynebacterium sp. ES2730-CONJ]MCU9519064.1 cytochrome c biogenesis CcdA family protein [Corynebacterium sp. ES2794-CONJ1]
MIDFGLLGAFLGGVLALLSPCSALLLPAFFAYAFSAPAQLLSRTGVFFLGLLAVLVPLGAGAGTLGSFLNTYRHELIVYGGVLICIMGVISFFGGGFRLGPRAAVTGRGYPATFFLGAIYGFSGFCAGPLLGAVLTTAVVGGSALYGALILAVYALGMTVPLICLALVWERFDMSSRSWLRGRTLICGPLRLNTMSMLSGLLFIGIGLLFIFSKGTTHLPSAISIDTQAEIQGWIVVNLGPISDVLVLLGCALLVALGLIIYILKKSPATSTSEREK